MVDLRTRYLGLELRNPLVASSSPLTGTLDGLKRLEAAGAGAVVLPSLFEEDLAEEAREVDALRATGATGAEARAAHPQQAGYGAGVAAYLALLEQAKASLSIPVIASLNGVSRGGWVRHAARLEQAGADALELNIYYVSSGPGQSGSEVEWRYLDIVHAVRQAASVPLAVKLSPYFSSVTNMAGQLVEAGANGLVLFNRFYQPDLDVETLDRPPVARGGPPPRMAGAAPSRVGRADPRQAEPALGPRPGRLRASQLPQGAVRPPGTPGTPDRRPALTGRPTVPPGAGRSALLDTVANRDHAAVGRTCWTKEVARMRLARTVIVSVLLAGAGIALAAWGPVTRPPSDAAPPRKAARRASRCHAIRRRRRRSAMRAPTITPLRRPPPPWPSNQPCPSSSSASPPAQSRRSAGTGPDGPAGRSSTRLRDPCRSAHGRLERRWRWCARCSATVHAPKSHEPSRSPGIGQRRCGPSVAARGCRGSHTDPGATG